MNTTIQSQISGRVLVTGGTGSWGRELCSQLLKIDTVQEIIIYSRNEHKQVDMSREVVSEKVKFVIGDIRDQASLKRAMKGVSIVFHLAALKHVPVCEANVWQTIDINIIGTQNVVLAAMEANVGLLVDVSTDKAVDPLNTYGISKACGERIVTSAQHNYASNTKFVCVRGGNVIGTNGSVIPLFKNQIENKNLVTVTDPTMTRFLMRKKEAIAMIFEAVNFSEGGETFVMKMPGTTVNNIVKTMVRIYGNKDTKIVNIGARPGEKKHEVLVSKNEAVFTYELNDKFLVIVPETINLENYKYLLTASKVKNIEYSSQNTKQLDTIELEKLIEVDSRDYNKA